MYDAQMTTTPVIVNTTDIATLYFSLTMGKNKAAKINDNRRGRTNQGHLKYFCIMIHSVYRFYAIGDYNWLFHQQQAQRHNEHTAHQTGNSTVMLAVALSARQQLIQGYIHHDSADRGKHNTEHEIIEKQRKGKKTDKRSGRLCQPRGK